MKSPLKPPSVDAPTACIDIQGMTAEEPQGPLPLRCRAQGGDGGAEAAGVLRHPMKNWKNWPKLGQKLRQKLDDRASCKPSK
jgi:hypothetical protein